MYYYERRTAVVLTFPITRCGTATATLIACTVADNAL